MLSLLALMAVLGQNPTTVEYIHEVHPRVQEQKAVRIARAIDAAAERYELDPRLLAAIVKTESNFESGIKACWIVLRYKTCQVTCDYGIAQINELWIKKWKLDPVRLQYDDRYNLAVAARILKMLEDEFADLEENWYGRYHSGTPSKRAIYEDRLGTFLARIP